MGRWRDSWAARNPSVRLARPMALTQLPLWFRATGSSALMEVLPDMAAASAGSAGCSLTRGASEREGAGGEAAVPAELVEDRREQQREGGAGVDRDPHRHERHRDEQPAIKNGSG